MSVSTLTIVLIIAYLVAIKIVALCAQTKGRHTQSDFFLADRSISCFLLVGTIIATMINTLAVTGVPALVYKGGILYLQMFVIGIIAPCLIFFFGEKVWKYGKEHNVLTQGEMFCTYYKSRNLLYLSALLGLLAIFPFMAIQLSAIGKVLSAATDNSITYEIAILISSASIGAYLYIGGARAVIWTDVIQAICFLAIIISSAILFTHWSGGYTAGIERLYEAIPHKLTFNTNNTSVFIDNILSWPFAFFLWPQLFQRMFMAKSAETIKKSVGWNFLFFNIIVLCTMTMGIMATGMLYGKIQDPDQLVALMFQEFMPVGGAFIVIAVFATGMSTIDSILLTSSSIVNRDIIKHLMPHRFQKEQEFQIARLTALLFLILVTCFALSSTGRGAMAPLVTLGASIATLFLWPLIGMFYWKSATSTAVISAMSLGFAAICLTKFTSIGSMLPFGSGTCGFLTSSVLFLGISFLTELSNKKGAAIHLHKESHSA